MLGWAWWSSGGASSGRTLGAVKGRLSRPEPGPLSERRDRLPDPTMRRRAQPNWELGGMGLGLHGHIHCESAAEEDGECAQDSTVTCADR